MKFIKIYRKGKKIKYSIGCQQNWIKLKEKEKEIEDIKKYKEKHVPKGVWSSSKFHTCLLWIIMKWLYVVMQMVMLT